MTRLMFVLTALVIPVAAAGQEREDTPEDVSSILGKVFDGGEWRIPTFAEALRALDEPPAVGHWGEPAVAVLRQTFGHSLVEVGAMTDELVRRILEGDEEQESRASVVLVTAADPDYPGVPYAGALDALIGVYELRDTNGDDRAELSLGDVFRAGGLAYVRRMFESHEPPPPCQPPRRGRIVVVDGGPPIPPRVIDNPCPNVSKWCDAGRLLLDVEGGPADREEFLRLCEWGRTIRH